MTYQVGCGLRGGRLWLAAALATLSLVLLACGGDGGGEGAPGGGQDVTDGGTLPPGGGGGGEDVTHTGGDPPPAQGGRGQACRPGGVCNSPLVCEAGTCVDAPDDEGALGGACRADGSCDAGLECVSDVCRAADAAEGELGGACTPDGTCDAGLECRDEVCRTAPVPPTETAPPTEPPPGGTGEPCERNADCPQGVCLPLSDDRQVCTLRCTSDDTCIPGWRCAPIGGIEGQVCQCDPEAEVCNGEDNSCNGRVDTPLSAETGEPDHYPLDCASGEVCVEGTCTCPSSLSICEGACVDVQSDSAHCGTCGNACEAFDPCVAGTCDEGAGVPAGFVGIRVGSFTMGSPETEAGRFSNEEQVSVILTRNFLLQATPVTQGQWETLMGSNPSGFQDCGLDCPVENVSWFDAVAYANALSASEGLAPCYDEDGDVVGGATVYDCEGYRLPTEAEWEYAARAGTTTATYNGDLPDNGDDLLLLVCDQVLQVLDEIAWFLCNSDTGTGRSTQPVRQKEPNAWGLYDMLGNVFEWTDTWYQATISDGVDPLGPSTGSARVTRGGGLTSPAMITRAPFRHGTSPEARVDAFGFRLARTAP